VEGAGIFVSDVETHTMQQRLTNCRRLIWIPTQHEEVMNITIT